LLLKSGILYGTTEFGGGPGDVYQGVIYQLDIATDLLTVLFDFTGVDGAKPLGGLIGDASGNLYGTTFSGGINGGSAGLGVAFELKLNTPAPAGATSGTARPLSNVPFRVP